jgi:hypothetical protein
VQHQDPGRYMSVGESWQQRCTACIDQARAGRDAAAAASDPSPVHQSFGAAWTVHPTSVAHLTFGQGASMISLRGVMSQ